MFLARGPETNQHRHTQTEISKVNSATCTSSHTEKKLTKSSLLPIEKCSCNAKLYFYQGRNIYRYLTICVLLS